MAKTKPSLEDVEKEYLEYVKLRAKNTNFQAKEKLQAIDELAEIVFEARKNYRKVRNSETV